MAIRAIHPGEHLAEELKELKMSAAALARKIEVPTNRVTAILNGQRAVTADTALRLAHFFGTSPEFWLTLQQRYELRLAGQKAGKDIEALPTLTLPTKLFADSWVGLFYDADDDAKTGNLDPSKREERSRRLQAVAMKEIWAKGGFESVTALLSGGGAGDIAGGSLALNITTANERTDFLKDCLSVTGVLEREVDSCMQEFLLSVDDEARRGLLSAVAEGTDTGRTVRLFRCAPFGKNTWRLLDRYDERVRERYWQEVSPLQNPYSDEELTELIDRLLEAKRPRAAFRAAHPDWSRVETSRLKRLLLAIATVGAEPAGHSTLEESQISEALTSLGGRIGIAPDEIAQLGILYIKTFSRSEDGVRTLERWTAESPILFVRALALAFKYRDDGQDPSEWRIADPERRADLVSVARRLLDQINCLPGTEGIYGKVDTKAVLAWTTEVRQLCAEHDLVAAGDQVIGQLLSRAPAEADGRWPCLPVCQVMERIASREVGTGFNIGVRNGGRERGRDAYRLIRYWRREDSSWERERAAEYRDWAKQHVSDYPYVSRVFEDLAADYDREAEWHEAEAQVVNRPQN